MLAAFFAVPQLIEKLGVERFGILSIAWVIVGYFGFFDLGLGRAMTQLIAQKIGNGQEKEVPSVIRNGMTLMIIFGVIGGVVVALLSPWLVNYELAIPQALRSETLMSFFILSASIPVVIITTGLRGILEARHRFDLVNIVRTPFAILAYIAPLFVLFYSNTLPLVVVSLIVGRMMMGIIYLFIILHFYPEIRHKAPFDPMLLKRLLSFGGWMTLSNIAGPLLLYMGRFVLAVKVSVDAVAYFSTPYDVVINLLLIPGIFVSTLFPIFSEKFHQNQKYVRILYNQWMRYTLLVMVPLSLCTYFLAKPGLSWWINEAFSENTHRIAEILVIGIFINSFGYISQALVQAYGRPNLTAQLHIVELIAYIPYLWWFIGKYGAEGAAMAWAVRVTISTIVLSILANGCLSGRVNKTMQGKII
jgi:O-antigen/teichoic acid export membrane protein